MLVLRFEFTAGRYHGTRWGTHVNEADVDWPPSPWRLLRAFLAVGYTRLGWAEGELPDTARTLLLSLASMNPVYHLPAGGVLSHTRHYMPQFAEGKSSKILDAFVRLPSGDTALYATWDLDLDDAQRAMLDSLLSHLSFLGRSESWVEASIATEVPEGLLRCSDQRTEYAEPLELLAAEAPEAYAGWRRGATDQALAVGLEEQRATRRRQGKQEPEKLTAAQRRKLLDGIPETLLDALSVDTGALRKQGWSRPPGSRTIRYWRPVDAVDSSPLRRGHSVGRGKSHPGVLLQLTSDTLRSPVLPPLRMTLRRSQRLHESLARQAEGTPHAHLLTGSRDGVARHQDHTHTHILPLSLGFSGSRPKLPDAPIDHVLLWSSAGYSPDVQQLLLQLRRQFMPGTELGLAVVGMGDNAALAGLVPSLRAARVWTSTTPWVPPRFLKRRGPSSIQGQLTRGLQQRGLPSPTRVELEGPTGWEDALELDKRAPWWRRFHLERDTRSGHVRQRPPQRLTFGVRLTFAEPVRGPLCLGYGAHFGLGRFDPEEH